MVYVDKTCATTSTTTWKPDAQFLLTINYIQPNPDYNNIMYTIYAGFTDTLKCVCVTKIKFDAIKFIILINKHKANYTKCHQPARPNTIPCKNIRLIYRALAFID